MEDIFCLNIPIFRVPYKRWRKYGYLKADEKQNTKEVLCEASDGYCMYCYSRIKVDKKLFGHLEHSIEKSNSDKLTECIPNIGIACSVCNQSFKKIGEQKRKVSDVARKRFEEKSKCSSEKRKQCTVPCKALRDLQVSYSEMPDAEIILQPMGIKGKQSGNPLAIQYDVLKMEFQPNIRQFAYSDDELMFIEKHILRFHLNDPEFRTRQLTDYIRNMIDNGGNVQQYEYNNMIVQLFVDKIKDKTVEEKVDICSKIYVMLITRL